MSSTAGLAERLWRGNSARLHYGVCGDCGEQTMVARQERCQTFQCLACFTAKPAGQARRILARARRQERLAA